MEVCAVPRPLPPFSDPPGPSPSLAKLSVGLPSWLLNEKNRHPVLLMYLLVLVIIIPTVVIMWYRKSRKYAANNVMKDTMSRFFSFFADPHMPDSAAPACVSCGDGGAGYPLVPSRRCPSPARRSGRSDLLVGLSYAQEFMTKVRVQNEQVSELGRLGKLVRDDRPSKHLKVRRRPWDAAGAVSGSWVGGEATASLRPLSPQARESAAQRDLFFATSEKIIILLHAWVRRLSIPTVLERDMEVVLRESDVLIDVSVAAHFAVACTAIDR